MERVFIGLLAIHWWPPCPAPNGTISRSVIAEGMSEIECRHQSSYWLLIVSFVTIQQMPRIMTQRMASTPFIKTPWLSVQIRTTAPGMLMELVGSCPNRETTCDDTTPHQTSTNSAMGNTMEIAIRMMYVMKSESLTAARRLNNQ